MYYVLCTQFYTPTHCCVRIEYFMYRVLQAARLVNLVSGTPGTRSMHAGGINIRHCASADSHTDDLLVRQSSQSKFKDTKLFPKKRKNNTIYNTETLMVRLLGKGREQDWCEGSV